MLLIDETGNKYGHLAVLFIVPKVRVEKTGGKNGN